MFYAAYFFYTALEINRDNVTCADILLIMNKSVLKPIWTYGLQQIPIRNKLDEK